MTTLPTDGKISQDLPSSTAVDDRTMPISSCLKTHIGIAAHTALVFNAQSGNGKAVMDMVRRARDLRSFALLSVLCVLITFKSPHVMHLMEIASINPVKTTMHSSRMNRLGSTTQPP
jgi:hypothetical protein